MKTTILLICALCFVYAQHEGMHHYQLQNIAATGDKCGTTSTAGSVKATLSTGSDGVEYKTIVSNGCPSYDWTSQSTPQSPLQYVNEVKIRTTPVINKTPTYIGVKSSTGATLKGVGGSLGVAVNGVAIFGNADADNRDAWVYESVSFDTCRGHPQQQGVYHYHAEPKQGCVYTDTPGKHSPLFGFMYDSIPIFGTLGVNGIVPKDLDECNGHVDTDYPFYHYHIQANLTYPYIINCLRGCVTATSGPLSQVAVACSPNATQYNYSALRYTMVTSNNVNAGERAAGSLTMIAVVLAVIAILY